jgi:hypothetical protein
MPCGAHALSVAARGARSGAELTEAFAETLEAHALEEVRERLGRLQLLLKRLRHASYGRTNAHQALTRARALARARGHPSTSA